MTWWSVGTVNYPPHNGPSKPHKTSDPCSRLRVVVVPNPIPGDSFKPRDHSRFQVLTNAVSVMPRPRRAGAGHTSYRSRLIIKTYLLELPGTQSVLLQQHWAWDAKPACRLQMSRLTLLYLLSLYRARSLEPKTLTREEEEDGSNIVKSKESKE